MNVIDAQLNYWDASLCFQREVSCFITPEHGVISITTGIIENVEEAIKTDGCGGAVDFDWDKIWGFLRKQEVRPSRIIMLHTHPMGLDRMSSTDLNMVQGWRLGLGVPVHFLVVTQVMSEGVDGVIAYYCVDKDENKKIQVKWSGKSGPIDHQTLDIVILSEILYGMSKSASLSHEDVSEIEETLKRSSLRF